MHTSLVARVNTFLLALLVLMAGSIIAILARGALGGPLDPPGPPASTGHNVIFQPASCAGFPIVISAPGSYTLGSDITGCSGQAGIQIAVSNVSLDLDGHDVNGGGSSSGSLTGIANSAVVAQIKVSNGEVQGWGVSGIDLRSSSVAVVDHVVATHNGLFGITINTASAVTDSTASANGANAPSAGIKAFGDNNRITACQTDSNIGDGVTLDADGTTVEDCEVSGNSDIGIHGTNIERIERNHVHNNTGDGVFASTSSTIEDNSVFWNGGNGIECGGNNCSVAHNTVGNDSGDGIFLNGGVGAVTDNTVFANGLVGIRVASPSAGFPNVVARNVAPGNAGGNYLIGANNDTGPRSAASGAGSAANYDQ